MDWSWATEGVTDEVPRTTGPECINYMTNRRRWIEAVFFTCLFIYIVRWAVNRLDPIVIPKNVNRYERHTAMRLLLLLAMTVIFGIEIGFKLAGKSVIFIMNPCHIQTMVQIYLLASKPSKTTIALFRIQMNNLNGPFLAFLFPEVECRTLPFEQATYWIQHALLYIIPVYILKTGAYKIEDITDYNWVTIGVMVMLLYHFVVLNALSIYTGINLNHMLCAAVADPFQGQNYRIAAVIHESILCPILNKVTVLLFCDDINHKFKRLPLQLAFNNQNAKNHNATQQQPQQQKLNRVHQSDSDKISIQNEASAMQTSNVLDNACTRSPNASSDTQNAKMLYHQKQLTPTEELSLAAEMAAALGTTTKATIRRNSNATTQILRHRCAQEHQQHVCHHHELYDFENVVDGGGDGGGCGCDRDRDGDDGDGDSVDANSSSTMALDREVELLLTNMGLEMNNDMHNSNNNHSNTSSSSNRIIVDYSTMPTTKID